MAARSSPHIACFCMLGASGGTSQTYDAVFYTKLQEEGAGYPAKTQVAFRVPHKDTQEYSFLITADILTCHCRRSTDESRWLYSIPFRQIQGKHAGSLKWNTADIKVIYYCEKLYGATSSLVKETGKSFNKSAELKPSPRPSTICSNW